MLTRRTSVSLICGFVATMPLGAAAQPSPAADSSSADGSAITVEEEPVSATEGGDPTASSASELDSAPPSSTVTTPEADDRLLPLQLDLALQAGWHGFNDSITTNDTAGDAVTSAGAFTFGVDLRMSGISFIKSLVVDLGYVRGGTSIDTPDVTPASASVAWSRLRVAVGWQFDLTGILMLRSALASAGYALERFSSDKQQPAQMTPSWTHHDIRVNGELVAGLLDDAILMRLLLDVAPYSGVSEEFQTNGKSPVGFGLDVGLAAEYNLGPILGVGGGLGVGGAVTFSQRWVSYSGQGTRPGNYGIAPVQGSAGTISRVITMATVTWHLPG